MLPFSGKIWFRNILEDQGYWNQYRSYYEAVEPGYYMFNFHALSRRGSSVTWVLVHVQTSHNGDCTHLEFEIYLNASEQHCTPKASWPMFKSTHSITNSWLFFSLELRKNNREVLAAYGDGEGYNTASNSGVFYLNRRDRVALHVSSHPFLLFFLRSKLFRII